VLFSACILIVIAVGINLPFRARRYPQAINAYLDRRRKGVEDQAPNK
jgi:hypothetical protein